MTSLFPHPAYAEDQPYARTILYLHTIRSGAVLGAVFPLITSPASLAISRYRHGTVFTSTNFLPRLLTHSARGLVIGSIFGAVATLGRMWGRDQIEWQDRSWRLLESKGQVEMDWWALDGGALGAVVGLVAARRGRLPAQIGVGQASLGASGLGVAAGLGGYMGWRYGLKGGKF